MTVRTSTSLPLNITPRTNRIAKAFGLLDDRVLSPTNSPSLFSDRCFRSLLRRSASELFSTSRATSLLSAKANLGARNHFVLALDGPGMSTDLFASPMAWSHANCIGVAFKYDVYFQDLESRAVVHLCRSSLSDGTVHSIDWGGKAKPYLLALGTTFGDVRVMDAEKGMQLVDWVDDGHGMGGMHWNGDVLAVGRAGGNVTLFDIRMRAEIANIMGHKRRVHGVKWSIDGHHLATGDDSGIVHIWDHRASNLLTNGDKNIRMKHKGPVKVCSIMRLPFCGSHHIFFQGLIMESMAAWPVGKWRGFPRWCNTHLEYRKDGPILWPCAYHPLTDNYHIFALVPPLQGALEHPRIFLGCTPK